MNDKKDKYFEEVFLSGLPPKNLEKMTENGVRDVQKTVVFRFWPSPAPKMTSKFPIFALLFTHFEACFQIFKANWTLKVASKKGKNDHFEG